MAESGSGGEASVPAILFAEFLASLFFVFLGGSTVSITGGLEAEARPFERIIAIAIIGQPRHRQTTRSKPESSAQTIKASVRISELTVCC